MYLTEQEIMDTPKSLKKTLLYFDRQKERIQEFFESNPLRKFTFIGCGSSYMLAKGAAVLFSSFHDTMATAIPAGDYMVDPAFWKETVRNSIVVILSRSGCTSEVIQAAEHIKKTFGCPVLSMSTMQKSNLNTLSDLYLSLDWCCDKSVCQTRTVTNLYASTLLIAALYAQKDILYKSVRAAAEQNENFQEKTKPLLKKLAAMEWDDVVVLADGCVSGAAEEASLAFTEIAMLTGRYFHLLDYRHGPVVVSGKNTLTLILMKPGKSKLQGDMVKDVAERGGPVLTVSDEDSDYGVTLHIRLEGIRDFSAWAIPFFYLVQTLALEKAKLLNLNPDCPKGLEGCICLKTR